MGTTRRWISRARFLCNAVLGVANDDDRVMSSAVGNGSVTVVDHDHERFEVIEVGTDDATTTVQ